MIVYELLELDFSLLHHIISINASEIQVMNYLARNYFDEVFFFVKLLHFAILRISCMTGVNLAPSPAYSQGLATNSFSLFCFYVKHQFLIEEDIFLFGSFKKLPLTVLDL